MKKFSGLMTIFLFSSMRAQAAVWSSLGSVMSAEVLPNGVELKVKTALVRVQELQPGIIRVRVHKGKSWPRDLSWAIVKQYKSSTQNVQVIDLGDRFEMQTSEGIIHIEKDHLKIHFMDLNKNLILSDAKSMSFKGGQFKVSKSMPVDEHYYGLGDKAGSFDHRGQSYQNWNSDAFAWQESSDPLYKTIPFYIGLRKSQAYGVFLDNTWRSFFDFGKTTKDTVVFGADGGELNYYFIYGPHPKAVVQKYAELVGKMPLPPIWALGYQQSRWSYMNEAKVREIASNLRHYEVPADVIYLDIDYQKGNAPFTIDEQKFPQFNNMVSDLKQMGIKTVLITDLHIKKQEGYAPYDQGIANDFFLKKADGTQYVGEVWPGPSVFPDFTLSGVRTWWGSLYQDFVSRGVAGFWNDMNEPAIFNVPSKTMPDDVVHRMDDGTSQNHLAIHNVYGMLNAKATYDGLVKLSPEERPFVLTRAAYAGAQRYAATWTGDNTSSWNHLRLMSRTLVNLGLSGFTMAGADIGGFVGSPTPELLTRWIQVGAFTPMFRNHTTQYTADQEPWVHGDEHLKIRRKYIELRYRLMPYIYSMLEESSRTGVPLMRPVLLEFPDQEKFYSEPLHGLVQQYMFGSDFLVIPKVVEMLDPEMVSIPEGTWYNFWSGEKVAGGKDILLNSNLETLPLFIREGAIIPMQPLVQSTAQLPNGPLELLVYPGPQCERSIYFDDGVSLDYKKGVSARLNVQCSDDLSSTYLKINPLVGSYQPWWKKIKVVLYGVLSSPTEVKLKINSEVNVLTNALYDSRAKSLTVEIDRTTSVVELRVSK